MVLKELYLRDTVSVLRPCTVGEWEVEDLQDILGFLGWVCAGSLRGFYRV